MHKVTSEIRELIVGFIPELPIIMELKHEMHYVDGTVLLYQGLYELEDGKKPVAGILYQQQMPVMIAANHRRRMIHAYQNEGINGLEKYIDEIIKLANNNEIITD